MRFFFDNCIAWRIAKAVAVVAEGQGHEVVALRDKFPEDAADEVWLLALGKEKHWNVISGDRRIYTNPHRRRVWEAAKLTTFFLDRAWLGDEFDHMNKVWRLMKNWNGIVEWAEKSRPGTALSLSIQGRIRPFR